MTDTAGLGWSYSEGIFARNCTIDWLLFQIYKPFLKYPPRSFSVRHIYYIYKTFLMLLNVVNKIKYTISVL